ncbi:MAG: S26 family signal peptidase [Actinomycetota bacterium]
MDMLPPSGGPTPETYHRGRKPFFRLVAGIGLTAGVAWACLRWKPSRVIIEGGSMAPTLAPGDWALAVPLRHPKVGVVVVVEHPGRPGYEMVKRLKAGPGDRIGDRTLLDDEWWIEGDLAEASTDSRQFGPVTSDGLKARVALVYWPRERRHRL